MKKHCAKCGKEFKTKWKSAANCPDCKHPYGREESALESRSEKATALKHKTRR